MSKLEPSPLIKAHHPSPIDALRAAINERLDNYIAAMDGTKAITLADVAQHQTNLWNLIKFVLSKSEQEFIQAYTVLLARIAQEREIAKKANRDGAFSSTRVMRGINQMNVGEKDRKAFTRIVHILVSTAPINTRTIMLRQIDFKQALSLFPGNVQEKVKAYYELL